MIRLMICWAVLSLGQCREDDSRIPPSITKSYPHRQKILQQSSRIELPCSATGLPKPRYQWLYNTRPLELSGTVTLLNDGSIVIGAFNKHQHNGVYQCKAINKYGEAFGPKIKLQEASLDYDTTKSPEMITVKEGAPLTLAPNNSVNSTPAARYTWKTVRTLKNLDVEEVMTGHRITLDKATGALYFANALLKDRTPEGRYYKLDALNTVQDVTVGVSPYKVIVEPNDKGPQPLTRLLPPQENTTITGLKGETVILKCFFGGVPTPKVEWEQPTNGPEPHRIDCTLEFNTECQITNLKLSDEGLYKCIGRNNRGTITSTIKLVVEASPTFDVKPVSMNITEGETATFTCRPNAKPLAEIEWFSNGNKIDVNDMPNRRMTISNDKTTLTIIEVCKDCKGTSETDLQVFQCRISNRHGDAYASAYLNVLLKTALHDLGAMNSYIINSTEEGLEAKVFNFSCSFMTDSLIRDSLEINWRLKKQKVPNRHPYKLQNKGRNLVINITAEDDRNLQEYIGLYTCHVTSPQVPNVQLKIGFNLTATMLPYFNMSTGEYIGSMWWLIIVAVVLMFTIIFLVSGLRGVQGNAGGEYMVYDHEIKDGNDPDYEADMEDFHEYNALHFARSREELAASKCSLASFVEV